MTVSTSPYRALTIPFTRLVFNRVNDDMKTDLPLVRLFNAQLHAITEAECVQVVIDELDKGNDGSVLTMNLDHLRRFNRDPFCRELYARATLHVADGMPLVWASRIQGTPLPERVTGSNLIWSLSEAAAKNGRSVFMLGGDPNTAESAAKVLKEHYPDLEVAGTFFPQHGFESREQEVAEMTKAIMDANPDIVFVALGTPKQDTLIEALRDYMPTVWWIGVGISFSFVTGSVSRAPRWMQDNGLEWIHRMAQEPKRLVKRYLFSGLPFCIRLFSVAVSNRFGRMLKG
ncbi:MAG: WecB/TagA/CpsF family glycosyltransferase [Candidatus Promineifilaceae bacterium]